MPSSSELPEGDVLILDVVHAARRAMAHRLGGFVSFHQQVGRAQLASLTKSATGPISAGDYEPNVSRVQRRWPAIDFSSGPSRPDHFQATGHQNDDGHVLELDVELARSSTEPRARVVDFSSGVGHNTRAERSDAAYEGQLLELNPYPEVRISKCSCTNICCMIAGRAPIILIIAHMPRHPCRSQCRATRLSLRCGVIQTGRESCVRLWSAWATMVYFATLRGRWLLMKSADSGLCRS